jgi:hypothetical protein
MNRSKFTDYAPQARRDFIAVDTDRAAYYLRTVAPDVESAPGSRARVMRAAALPLSHQARFPERLQRRSHLPERPCHSGAARS